MVFDNRLEWRSMREMSTISPRILMDTEIKEPGTKTHLEGENDS